jgi:hypothetical protein
MNFFSALTSFQIAGTIMLAVSVPLLMMMLRYWVLSDQSIHWPKTRGVVIDGFDFTMSGTLRFSYEYAVNGKRYTGKKPFFTNSFKNLGRDKIQTLGNRYPQGQHIEVYYHPQKHSLSVLEPGRKDGILSGIILMMIFFLLGLIALFDHTMITNLALGGVK